LTPQKPLCSRAPLTIFMAPGRSGSNATNGSIFPLELCASRMVRSMALAY
jgi:hypothetical protein